MSTFESNFDWVLPWLATGGDLGFHPDTMIERARYIANSGFGYVVDLREEADDEELWEALGADLTYTHVPTDDRIGHHIPAHVFDTVVGIGRIARHQDVPMLVHCHMGINRGPSAAFAVLLDVGYRREVAYNMVSAARPEAGLYYAMDAYKAHLARTGNRTDGTRVELFQEFLDEKRTPEEQARIAHIIREKHDFDLRELFDR